MLPGFLTTALEIIIVLDVCGAIAYFALTGLTRVKKRAESPVSPPPQDSAPTGLRAFGFEGAALAPALQPAPATQPAAPLYTPEPTFEPKRQWSADLKRRFDALKARFTYRPAANGQAVETRRTDADFDNLGRVLDSFKEDA